MATEMLMKPGPLPTEGAGPRWPVARLAQSATVSRTPEAREGGAPRVDLAGRQNVAGPASVSAAQVSDTINDLTEFAQVLHRELQFNVDAQTGKTVIRVLDAESGETIRQIPPEHALALANRLQELIESGEPGLKSATSSEEAVGLFLETLA